MCETNDYWKIKEAERILSESEIKYKESKSKKWIIMSLGLVIGALLGYYIPIGFYKLTQSSFDRSSIDNLLGQMFGQYRIEDALTDEVMAIAYSFNAQQPRFYTKFNSVNNPLVYNLTMADAVGASSSLPIYFEPKVLVNGLN